jgi:hypothetical protein
VSGSRVLNDDVPNVSCPNCRLTSYAPTPHSTASPCPYCDAELFPRIRPAHAARPLVPEAPAAAAEPRTAEAA